MANLRQRRYAPVDRSNAQCGPAGLARVQMCQRESRAHGSCTTEWQRPGQPNRPLMHSVSLACSTGPDIEHWMEPVRLSQVHTDMQLHSRTACSPCDIGVVHLCEVTLCGLFCPWNSSHWLSWVMALTLAMPDLRLRSAALSDSCSGCQCHSPKLAATLTPL